MTSRFRSIGLAVRIEPVREFPQRSPFVDAFDRITGASVFVKVRNLRTRICDRFGFGRLMTSSYVLVDLTSYAARGAYMMIATPIRQIDAPV
ncbi:hypothetical protein, partial [Antrihabitans spumae]